MIRLVSGLFLSASAMLAQPVRIAQTIDSGAMVQLAGNIPSKAQREYDQGPVQPSSPMQYVTMQLQPSAVEYVRGEVHTNGLENFWSLLKRGIHGTYVSVEPFHLFRYLDEQAFRYNNRKGLNDGERFDIAVRRIFGKRLTWDQLTGKVEADAQENRV